MAIHFQSCWRQSSPRKLTLARDRGPAPAAHPASGVAPPPGTSRHLQPLRCSSLLPPRVPPLQPHLEVPPEVLTQGAEVGDILQRGFELQRNFLQRGRASASASTAPAQPYRAPAPPLLDSRSASPAPSQREPTSLIPSWHELPPPKSSPPPRPCPGGSLPPPHPHSGLVRHDPARRQLRPLLSGLS